MASERDSNYAAAVVAVAAAEGELDTVQNEVFAVAQAVAGSDELMSTLSDQQVPVSRRQQVIEDILGGGRVSPTTLALVSMIIGTGRARDLPGIAESVAALGAAQGGQQLAVVRSAIELTDDQRARLADALREAVGGPVEVQVVIDHTVMGGLVAKVGDTVIDGSVRRHLDQLKHAI